MRRPGPLPARIAAQVERMPQGYEPGALLDRAGDEDSRGNLNPPHQLAPSQPEVAENEPRKLAEDQNVAEHELEVEQFDGEKQLSV